MSGVALTGERRVTDRQPSILILDDEPGMLRAMKRWLGKRAQVTTTDDPAEALRMLAVGDFDLVLCDCNMPRMGGFEFASAARQLVPEMAKRIVIMTGEDRGQSWPSGQQVVVKPLRPETVNGLLASRGWPSVVTVRPPPPVGGRA